MDNLYQTASTTTQTNNTNISFYCMICFDTFNKTTRAPVILPCGHTFVCSQCSKRLKSCMECRTSLFLQPEKSKQQQQQNQYQRGNSGYSPRTYRRHVRGSPEVTAVKRPPPQEPPIPLPLPKNELMLSLLESANYVLHNKREHIKDEGEEDDDDDDENILVCIEVNDKEAGEGEEVDTIATPPNKELVPAVTSSSWSSEEEDHDAEKVFIALETSLGSGGTYAVIDSNGLDILPYKPEGYIDKSRANHTECTNNLKLPSNLTRLNYGDRIQVVDVQETMVKLARNRGYIIATNTQLVKISVPSDDACLIESLLTSVQPKYRKLNRMLVKLNTVEAHLLQDLNQALQQNDYPPFIMEPTAEHDLEHHDNEDIRSNSPSSLGAKLSSCKSPPSPDKPRHVEFNLRRNNISYPPPPPTPSYNHPEVIKPNRVDVQEEGFVTAAAGCTSFFGMGSHADIDTDSSIEDNTNYYTGIFCPSANQTIDTINRPSSDTPDSPTALRERSSSCHSTPARRSAPITNTATSATSSPARIPLPLDAVVSSFVDFRTGRSGHSALTASKSHLKKTQVYTRGAIRMMSDHKGIGKLKPSMHRNNLPDSPYSTNRGQRSNLSNKTW